MKSPLLPISFVATLLVTPVLVWAQTQDSPSHRPGPRGESDPRLLGPAGPGGHARPRWPGRETLMAELGLTEAQRKDIRKVVEGARRDRLRKSTDLKIARMDLRSMLREEKVDEKAVSVKLAETQTAQSALLKSRVDSVLAMKRILTPEQQKKMGELRRDRGLREGRPRARMRGGRGLGPGRGSAALPDVRDDLDENENENEDEDPYPLATVVR